IFSWSATLAAVRWSRGPAVLNQHIFKVIERPGVYREFLRHLLNWSIPFLAEESHGSTMKHIRKGVLDDFVVAVPPIPEQRKIAGILAQVDDPIDAAQAVIDQIEKVKRAMMAHLLTRGIPNRHPRFKQMPAGEVPEAWSTPTLEEITERITYGFTNPMPST